MDYDTGIKSINEKVPGVASNAECKGVIDAAKYGEKTRFPIKII